MDLCASGNGCQDGGMAESPPANSPPPRRQRRWLRRVVLGVLLMLLAVWLVRVPLANWWLRRLPGDWAVSITGLQPGFSALKLEGVRVRHRPTGKQLTCVERVDVANGWTRMVKGELGTLTLTGADVEWRPEFETPYIIPPEGGPPARVLVAWDAGSVQGGVFRWYEAGRDLPRLSMRITGFEGKRFAIFSDGRVEAAEQDIALADVVSREFAQDGAVEIESRSAVMEGVATAQREGNRYTVETVNLKAPECRVRWQLREPASAAPAVEGSAVARPAWDKPAEFFIRQGTAEPGRVALTLDTGTGAPAELAALLQHLETGGMRIAGGLPFVFGSTHAILTEVESPAATLKAREVKVTTSYDEAGRFQISTATVSGAQVEDSTRLLKSAGVPEETAQYFLICRGGLDAEIHSLTAGLDGVSSTELQRVVLRDFTAVMPGDRIPLVKTPRAELTALPAELLHKHLRSVSAEYAEVMVTENAFTDELNPVRAAPASPEAPPAAGPDKPRWYGWHTDHLTVQRGRVRGVDMGPGIPDAEGNLRVETVVRPPGADNYYRAHISSITLTNPLLSVLPKIESTLEVDIHPLRVYETESVDEVRVNGVKVELSEALLKLFQAADRPAPEPPDAGAPGAGEAHIP